TLGWPGVPWSGDEGRPVNAIDPANGAMFGVVPVPPGKAVSMRRVVPVSIFRRNTAWWLLLLRALADFADSPASLPTALSGATKTIRLPSADTEGSIESPEIG